MTKKQKNDKLVEIYVDLIMQGVRTLSDNQLRNELLACSDVERRTFDRIIRAAQK